MQRMKGGHALAATLKAEGIDHVFGIVGTHDCPLFDGVHGDPYFKVVTVRHEQGAALMAAGFARASGRIAACFVVPGPGLTNALTGMGMAYTESAPMLVFGGQNAVAQLETEGGHFHELADSVNVAASVCAYATRVHAAADLPRTVAEALRTIRCGRPRPAYIEVPLDVQSGEADIAPPRAGHYPRPAGDPQAVQCAAQALRSARRPFIFAGGGVESAGACAQLAQLAERLGAPVVTSVFGTGAISARHQLALGDGWGRLPLYAELFTQADLVLVVGSRIDVVSDVNLGRDFPARMVQVDIDARVVGQRRAVEAGVVGDAGLVLAALDTALADLAPRPCWFDAAGFRARKQALLAERTGPVMDVIGSLRAAMPEDTIFVDDLTLVGYWMPLLMPTYQPRSLIHPGTYGTLGYALPAAIGARLACPQRPVLCLSGDGGFLFTVQELATARALGLDLICVVFNDNAFGAIRTYQDRVLGGRNIGADLVNPDFVRLGEAFGARSLRVAPEGLGAAVREAHRQGGLWLLEVPFAPPGTPNLVPWMP